MSPLVMALVTQLPSRSSVAPQPTMLGSIITQGSFLARSWPPSTVTQRLFALPMLTRFGAMGASAFQASSEAWPVPS